MIVFRSPFVLSEAAAGRPLTHPRIGYQNHIRDQALDASDVTVSTEDEDGPRDAPLRADTTEYWQPTALPATWTLDLGAGLDIDYVGIAGHTLGSDACGITVATSDGSMAGSPSAQVWTTFAQAIAPGDDAALLFLDDSVTARYLRLTITGLGDEPRIAVVNVGEALAMYRPIYGGHTPLTLSRQTVLRQALSRGGQFVGQSFQRFGLKTAVAFKHLDADWVRDSFDPFVKSARQFPYFFGWRPADWPLEVGYVWTDKDIAPSNMGVGGLMQVAWSMQGTGNE